MPSLTVFLKLLPVPKKKKKIRKDFSARQLPAASWKKAELRLELQPVSDDGSCTSLPSSQEQRDAPSIPSSSATCSRMDKLSRMDKMDKEHGCQLCHDTHQDVSMGLLVLASQHQHSEPHSAPRMLSKQP